MSSKEHVVVGKSPYAKANRTWRGRGTALLVTVLILLLAAGAWIVSFTKAVEHSGPTSSQTVDPAGIQPGNTTGAPASSN